MSPHASSLVEFVLGLKRASALPANLQFSRIGKLHMAAAFDEQKFEIISEAVNVGMDFDPDLAALKALVERVERRAFQEGAKAGVPQCQTERSDGFAAFPRFATAPAAAARSSAFFEAVERFAWASWWDNPALGHSAAPVDLQVSELFRSLSALVPLRECLEVIPKMQDAPGTTVILFAFLEPVGVISGGACGKAGDIEHIRLRAFSELARHALAVKRLRESGLEPSTFYQRRLAFFGNQLEGERIVRARLAMKGEQALSLPPLALDAEVPHSLSALAYVHRCLFENQPPFVGGAMERLCL